MIAQYPTQGAWKTGLCDSCFTSIACWTAWQCPCIVYGSTLSKMHSNEACCAGYNGALHFLYSVPLLRQTNNVYFSQETGAAPAACFAHLMQCSVRIAPHVFTAVHEEQSEGSSTYRALNVMTA